MIIFDTLDNLELYLSVKPELRHVIDIMDRSLPYDQKPGSYECPENKDVRYEVKAYLTKADGYVPPLSEGKLNLEIILEGESVTSIDGDNVFRMAPGRFLITDGSQPLKRGMTQNLPVSVKSVVFSY